jgi:hypothetical protein
MWCQSVSNHVIIDTCTKTEILYRSRQTTPEQEREADLEVSVTLNNTVLYNGMIHPLTRMVIRGVIWYQGILLM